MTQCFLRKFNIPVDKCINLGENPSPLGEDFSSMFQIFFLHIPLGMCRSVEKISQQRPTFRLGMSPYC